jgi:hypothetical protein
MDCLRFICIKMLNRLLFHTHIALNLYFISYLDREYDTIQRRLWVKNLILPHSYARHCSGNMTDGGLNC